MEWSVTVLSDWDSVAREILNKFPDKKIFSLYGEMGAGKTTLVKSICKALGVTEAAVSPTFSLVNEYDITYNNFFSATKIFHFDLYRLKNAEELLDIGFEEYLTAGAFCFIEWPQLAEHFLPSSTVKVNINLAEEGIARTVKIN